MCSHNDDGWGFFVDLELDTDTNSHYYHDVKKYKCINDSEDESNNYNGYNTSDNNDSDDVNNEDDDDDDDNLYYLELNDTYLI